MDCAGNAGAAFVDVDIYFAADAEFREIDAGLDGSTRTRNEAAHIVSFQIIHIRAVSMNCFSNVVAGAMEKIFSVAGFFDDGARGFIDLPALQRLAGGGAGADQVHCLVASIGDGAKNFGVFFRDLSCPGSRPR